jgi:hypothetical protein
MFAKYRWFRALNLKTHQRHFDELYQAVNGFALSQIARQKGDAMEYTYGEIEFIPFIALLSLVHPDKDTVFYDLGSGTGKAILACAMVFTVKKSCGIELFEELHQSACDQKQHLERIPEYQEKAQTIQFMHTNFLQADISDATLIFINASALFGDTWEALSQRLRQLKSGTIILMTSKKLSCDVFEIKKETLIQMSWGVVRVFVFVRR